jgi:hypothetical protein
MGGQVQVGQPAAADPSRTWSVPPAARARACETGRRPHQFRRGPQPDRRSYEQGQALTASISRCSVILSPTTTPPFCIGALKLMLKSLRLSSPVAVNPAR